MTSLSNSMGNSFSTPVGQKIEEVTDSGQGCYNWTLVLEVCDSINTTEDGPKEAIRAIRKRLQENVSKNYDTILHTLTLLKVCVKNCHRRFHVLVCGKDFVQDLIKILESKSDLPVIIRGRAWSLIQSWAEKFHNEPDMSAIVQMYNELKMTGIDFPITDLVLMAPIHTPRKMIPDSATTKSRSIACDVTDVNTECTLRRSSKRMAKLRSDIDMVRKNITALKEMSIEMVSGQDHTLNRELLSQSYHTCEATQDRLVELICQPVNDKIITEVLRISNFMNNVFLRSSTYEDNLKSDSQKSGIASVPLSPSQPLSLTIPDLATTKLSQLIVDSELQLSRLDVTDVNTEYTLRRSLKRMAKLRSDIDMVLKDITALKEMSIEMVSGQDHTLYRELLSQSYHTCEATQDRLVELISQPVNDKIITEVLRISNFMSNVFLRYSRRDEYFTIPDQPVESSDDNRVVKTETLVNDLNDIIPPFIEDDWHSCDCLVFGDQICDYIRQRIVEILRMLYQVKLIEKQVSPKVIEDARNWNASQYANHTLLLEDIIPIDEAKDSILSATKYAVDNVDEPSHNYLTNMHEYLKPDCEEVGIYRTGDAWVTGTFRKYKMVKPTLIHQQIEELLHVMECIRDAPDTTVMLIGMRVMVEFVIIHPFQDGNGRSSRILFSAILRKIGFPHIIVPVEKKSEYCGSLGLVQLHKNYEPIYIFLLACVQNSLRSYIKKIKNLVTKDK